MQKAEKHLDDKKSLTVMDVFCGAGGFSEGFRQQGFRIVHGMDKYLPAVETYNSNFGLDCTCIDLLDLSISYIESLPDTSVIIGSPPCISFSNSNRSGKSDKSMGLRLIDSFLRIVAIKKFMPNSILKAWVMENVPKSIRYLKDEYTFRNLALDEWAENNKYDPDAVAISLKGKMHVLNSVDYGSPQNRLRAIVGEVFGFTNFPKPIQTHWEEITNSNQKKWRILGEFKKQIPSPFSKKSNRIINDPNYESVSVPLAMLTDHFYDTGLYESQWRSSKFHKLNHPYMGRMAFPENENNPSRTVTATNIGTSRESIIYKAELERIGDGEFRGPTVREGACLMGFPVTFQFLGSESSKWKMVGNAVCPHLSSSIAKMLLMSLGKRQRKHPIISMETIVKLDCNLNTFTTRAFDRPPTKKGNAKFRRHPFKKDNVVVSLSNFSAFNESALVGSKWYTTIYYGIGDGYNTQAIADSTFKKLENKIKNIPKGDLFLKHINNGFSERIGSGEILQKLYESQKSSENHTEPTLLVDEIGELISQLEIEHGYLQVQELGLQRNRLHVFHLLSLYAVNLIATIANQNYKV